MKKAAVVTSSVGKIGSSTRRRSEKNENDDDDDGIDKVDDSIDCREEKEVGNQDTNGGDDNDDHEEDTTKPVNNKAPPIITDADSPDVKITPTDSDIPSTNALGRTRRASKRSLSGTFDLSHPNKHIKRAAVVTPSAGTTSSTRRRFKEEREEDKVTVGKDIAVENDRNVNGQIDSDAGVTNDDTKQPPVIINANAPDVKMIPNITYSSTAWVKQETILTEKGIVPETPTSHSTFTDISSIIEVQDDITKPVLLSINTTTALDDDSSEDDAEELHLLSLRSPFAATAEAKRDKNASALTNEEDRALQRLLWRLGFQFLLKGHQPMAVRKVAGLPPDFPLHHLKEVKVETLDISLCMLGLPERPLTRGILLAGE